MNNALGVIMELLKFLNTESSRKYTDKLYELEKSILKEWELGALADDSRLEHLYKERQITLDASKNEILLALAKK